MRPARTPNTNASLHLLPPTDTTGIELSEPDRTLRSHMWEYRLGEEVFERTAGPQSGTQPSRLGATTRP